MSSEVKKWMCCLNDWLIFHLSLSLIGWLSVWLSDLSGVIGFDRCVDWLVYLVSGSAFFFVSIIQRLSALSESKTTFPCHDSHFLQRVQHFLYQRINIRFMLKLLYLKENSFLIMSFLQMHEKWFLFYLTRSTGHALLNIDKTCRRQLWTQKTIVITSKQALRRLNPSAPLSTKTWSVWLLDVF